jgi:hypothetical protein
MFADGDGFDYPPNPAVDNEEAMRRAVQVFFIMNKWAALWLDYEDSKLTAQEVVDKFNDELSVIGMAYQIEMQMDPMFLVQIITGHEDLLNKIAAAEVSNSEENN